MKDDKIIMYDSPEAATYRTDIKGWVSSDGIFCGDGSHGEQSARYRGATHTKCKCGNLIKMRSYTICDTCRRKKELDYYNSLPYKEYDGSPVVDYHKDTFFFKQDDIEDYLEENELESIDLLFCEEKKWAEVNYDFWNDDLPEDSDGELPKKLVEALENLNKVIRELPPCSYSPGKVRTTFKRTDSK